MNNAEFAKKEIFSELNAIMKLHGDKFTYNDAHEHFLDDFYDCYHVKEFKKQYADAWLKEKFEK